MNDNALVAIHCLAYNHEPYIRECLEGFVMQKTNFRFVAIVHEDASTDRTADIIREYESKYPEIIKPIYETENQWRKPDGSLGRIMDAAIDATEAKYVAMCEGDDYWTDPYKLQKQVDFLEEHEDYSMCVNRTSWLLNNGSLCDDMSCCYENDQDLSTDEIIRYGGLYVNTVSTIYRNKSIKRDEFQWWKMADVGDYPLHIAASLRGKVRYFADDMSVYRYQCEGSWTSRTNQNYPHIKNEVAWLEELDEETNGKYVSGINFHLWRFYSALYKKRYVGFRPYWSSIRKSDEKKTVMYKRMIKDVIIRIIK